jgi:hypothetical protein
MTARAWWRGAAICAVIALSACDDEAGAGPAPAETDAGLDGAALRLDARAADAHVNPAADADDQLVDDGDLKDGDVELDGFSSEVDGERIDAASDAANSMYSPGKTLLCFGDKGAGVPMHRYLAASEFGVVTLGGNVTSWCPSRASPLTDVSHRFGAVEVLSDGSFVGLLTSRTEPSALYKIDASGTALADQSLGFSASPASLEEADNGDLLLAGKLTAPFNATYAVHENSAFAARFAPDRSLRWFVPLPVDDTFDWTFDIGPGGKAPALVRGGPAGSTLVAIGSTLIKLGDEGTELWRTSIQTPAGIRPSHDLLVTDAGDVYAAGPLFLTRIASDGNVSWTRSLKLRSIPQTSYVIPGESNVRVSLAADGLRMIVGGTYGQDLGPTPPDPLTGPVTYVEHIVTRFDLEGAARGEEEFTYTHSGTYPPDRTQFVVTGLRAFSSGRMLISTVQIGVRTANPYIYQLNGAPIPSQ